MTGSAVPHEAICRRVIGVRRLQLVLAMLLAGASMLAACGGPAAPQGLINVSGGEPQNALIPTNTNENQGGRILDRLFAGLMSYDADGTPRLEVAQAIDTVDNINFRITLKSGWTFTDGSPVTAESFVNAWNYGALSTNAQAQHSFFSAIKGYDEVAAQTPAEQTMSGLQVVSDTEFTVRLKAPTIDFVQRLAFTPFYPLPKAAFDDMAAFGQHPIGDGPYQLAPGDAWQHNVRIDLVPNPEYRGNRVPKNDGLRFVFYSDPGKAYADLLAGKLDVLDSIPDSALPTYRKDLGDRAMTAPTAQNQTLDTPLRLPHFAGEEGRLRRLALSAAIDRQRICGQMFLATRTPARDFTASSLPGFDRNLQGNDALDFDPETAQELWAQADDISPWTGQYVIAYNADGDHQQWVDAVADSISQTLGIDAVGSPQPTFAQIRAQITDRSIPTAFRAGWKGDYPSMLAFLEPVFLTGAAANDVDYSDRGFDGALTVAQAAPTLADSYALTNAAQQILLADMPVIPLWDYVTVSGRSAGVSDVTITWNGLPAYEQIVKS
jgi:oligopeptide transport system substrate-binding protein